MEKATRIACGRIQTCWWVFGVPGESHNRGWVALPAAAASLSPGEAAPRGCRLRRHSVSKRQASRCSIVDGNALLRLMGRWKVFLAAWPAVRL